MNRESATALMEELLKLSEQMNQVCARIDQLQSKEDREALRRGMSGMLADVYTELMRPLIQQFPELDPDKRGPAS